MFRPLAAAAVAAVATVSVPAADWPQWMGPTRDGVWNESGVLDRFPAGGPKPLWRVPVGGGYAGPAVAAGRVYVHDYHRTAGDDSPAPGRVNKLTGEERVTCFDAATGKQVWQKSYPCPYKLGYPAGPRCTPTVAGGRVFTLGAMGDLRCFAADTGEVKWAKNLPADEHAAVPRWGFCSHPLADGDRVICLVGGADGLLMAFDAATGTRKWAAGTTPTGDDGPGYGAPALIEHDGVRSVVVWSSHEVLAADPDTGHKRWAVPLAPQYGMAVMAPQRSGRRLFVGGMGTALALDLDPAGGPPAVAWHGHRDSAVYPTNATPLVQDGVIYGADASGHLRAVELATGHRLWERVLPTTAVTAGPQNHGTAFLVRHGERFFVFKETGHLAIARLDRDGYHELDDAPLLEPTATAFGRKVAWSHPAFADRRVFARNDKELVCYSLAE